MDSPASPPGASLPGFSPSLPPAAPTIDQDYIPRAPVAPTPQVEVPKDLLDDGWIRNAPKGPFQSVTMRGRLLLAFYLLSLIATLAGAVLALRWSYAIHDSGDPWGRTARTAEDDAWAVFAFGGTVMAIAQAFLAAWSNGVVKNLRLIGFTYAKVGRATWGWYVPFVNLFLPFQQLRWIPRENDLVLRWQRMYVFGNVLLPIISWVAMTAVTLDMVTSDARNLQLAIWLSRFVAIAAVMWFATSATCLVFMFHLVRRTDEVFAYIAQRLD